MSKYYKAEEVEKLLSCGCAYAIRDLPTIEVSEEVLKATKKFNAYTIADENAEMGMRTQIEPTIEVSEDCISREQFREQMYHRCFEVDNDENMQKWDSGNWLRWKLFEEELENAPSVMPKDHIGESTEMVGEWIKEMHTNKVQIWKCDQCAEMIEQSIQYEYPRWNFCPNCGARMKGAEE